MIEQAIIIGGGQAAFSCAAKLRQLGPQTAITILSDEPTLPYQRPPLSKQYCQDKLGKENLLLRDKDWFATHKITCITNSRVAKIDRPAQIVHTVNGHEYRYDRLVFATGSRPRMLPQEISGGLSGIHVLRSIQDADLLKTRFDRSRNALIVGGGYIGLEAASVFRDLGINVCLIEATERILKRVASAPTAEYFHALHLEHGVVILEGVGLERLEADANNKVIGAYLSNGTKIATDLVLVGIGGIANDDLAAAAGLECDNGILVNKRGLTSDSHIYACGDCAKFEFSDSTLRLESVQNAVDQGEAVAADIADHGYDYEPLPWFWSDQYETKLQIAGLSAGFDKTAVRQGKRPGSQSIWYYKKNKLIAVDAINDPQAYMVARRLLAGSKSPAPAIVSSSDIDLKSLLTSAV